ncbi:MAG TPA: M23 family metallopeptidase [Opitutaceae bacterium]|nr:M23 family metallopeptidase [Opitutaceae bacterium]
MKLLGWIFLPGALLIAAAPATVADRIAIVWPTPNDAFAQGRPLASFLQDAGSGDPESGGFGCVRSSGGQFHEGIDIKALARDRSGEPVDDIYAAMDGVVRYINIRPGESSYGRYIVMEHPDLTPAVYTLYAHLTRVAPGIVVGARVGRGQVIATMGHSAGGYAIPRERAHLHFEIGLWVTRDFQAWYDGRKFGSRNEHGVWNGMNLMGFDPLDFLRQYRARQVDNFQEYLARQPTAVRVRIATHRVPDFVQRYPSLLTKPMPLTVDGWDIRFNWTGLPIALTPLGAMDVLGLPPNKPVLSDVSAEIERRERCKTLVVSHRGSWSAGRDLETVLQQLFALR